MKRLTIYTIMVLLLGGMALTLAHRAQTQDVTEDTAVPHAPAISDAAAGGATTPVFSYQGQLLDAQGNPVTGSVPMTFRLYATATGGTACWTELYTGGNEVAVQGGRFSILLGSITPTDADCLAEDAYLELQINSETLSPRQLLTDAIVSSGSLLGTTTVGQDLSFTTYSSSNIDRGAIFGKTGGALALIADSTPLSSSVYGWFRGAWINLGSLDNSVMAGSIRINLPKDINQGNNPEFEIYRVQTDGFSQELMKVDENGNMNITSSATVGQNLHVYGPDINLGNGTALRRDGRDLHLLPWGGSGYAYDRVCIGCGSSANLTVNGNLDVNGSCNASIEGGDEVTGAGETCTAVRLTEDGIQTGAVIELNLMTAAERAAGRIDRFTQGDVLCWSTQTERLEICDQANTRLVMAVANAKGLPIIQGAEPVKVIGPVMAGDLLVASNVPGYAMANNNPAPGTVLGKAMDNFNGESGLIKAMIFQW